jgi:NADH-quinone oxidoreductase subunit E
LEHAECLAACDYGPVLTVNYEFFDKVDVESALGVITRLQQGERPTPSRGARLCTLKEMSLQLAGLPPEGAGSSSDWAATGVADGLAGDPTLRGNRLAEQYGVSVPDFDPDTPIARPKADRPAPVPPTSKPASDRKPAGDAPLPQEEKLAEARSEGNTP